MSYIAPLKLGSPFNETDTWYGLNGINFSFCSIQIITNIVVGLSIMKFIYSTNHHPT